MKYTAQFYDINEKLYTLEIGSGEMQNITLSATPFITELETSDSHLYKPCKYSSATIGMITDDYKFDLYSSTAQQNKVVLSSARGIVWVGYVTPNLYSQGYENELEEIEVEAIDALSTLQYYKYTIIGSKKDIVSFTQMLLPVSATTKGVLWVVFFGLAKTFQYAALLILGTAGLTRIKAIFKYRK